MKKDISIIIPIKDRAEFTFRSLCYLSSIKFPFKIFICDGSFNKSNNKKIVNKFKKKIPVTYLSFPYDKNYLFFLNKLKKTLRKVKTKYVILLPNDDFINLDFLKILHKKKSNYESVSGINIDFKINNYIRYINDYGKTKFYSKVKNQYDPSLNNKNMLKRIKFISKFNPYESIHSKKVLLDVLNYSIEFSVNNHKEFMWFFKLIPLFLTRVIFINKPLIARQVNTYSSEGFGLYSRDNFSSKSRLIEFKNFIYKKTKNETLHNIITEKDFPTKPNVTFKEKIIINLIYIKKFFKKRINFFYTKKQKYSFNNYEKLFKLTIYNFNYFKK